MATRSAVIQTSKVRNFCLNRPFWILMREKNYHPYFVAYINKTEDKWSLFKCFNQIYSIVIKYILCYRLLSFRS